MNFLLLKVLGIFLSFILFDFFVSQFKIFKVAIIIIMIVFVRLTTHFQTQRNIISSIFSPILNAHRKILKFTEFFVTFAKKHPDLDTFKPKSEKEILTLKCADDDNFDSLEASHILMMVNYIKEIDNR
jgi:cell shape-determining protein MreC